MQALDSKFHSADIIAAFDHRTDAEKVIVQLQQAGFRDRHIGFFAWHPFEGLKSLFRRNYARECAIAGAVVGALVGLWVAPLLAGRLAALGGILGSSGLALLGAGAASVLLGFLGWEIGLDIQAGGEAPVVPAADGSFILTVSAGAEREWVWSVVHRHGGYELQHALSPI